MLYNKSHQNKLDVVAYHSALRQTHGGTFGGFRQGQRAGVGGPGLAGSNFNDVAMKRPLTSQTTKVTTYAGGSGTVAMQGGRLHTGVNSSQNASGLETNTLDQHSRPINMVQPTMDQIIYNAIDDGSVTAQSHSLIHPGQVGGPAKLQTIQSTIVSESQPVPPQAMMTKAKDKTQTEPIQDQASKESTEELSGPQARGGRKRSDKVATLERSKNKESNTGEDEEDENAQALSAVQTDHPGKVTGDVGRSFDSANPQQIATSDENQPNSMEVSTKELHRRAMSEPASLEAEEAADKGAQGQDQVEEGMDESGEDD